MCQLILLYQQCVGDTSLVEALCCAESRRRARCRRPFAENVDVVAYPIFSAAGDSVLLNNSGPSAKQLAKSATTWQSASGRNISRSSMLRFARQSETKLCGVGGAAYYTCTIDIYVRVLYS
jgi:hypothetical protein